MPNLRVISDNAIDRATLSSDQTATNFSPTSLQTARKSDVWRAAAGPYARVTALWAALEPIQAIALPFCNPSNAAIMRVRVTNEPQATNMLSATTDFNNAAWGRYGTVTTDVTAAPDGTVTADKLTGTADDGYATQTAGVVAGETYTMSVWLRADSPITCYLYLFTNLSSNVAGLTASVTTTWQRFSLSLTASSTASVTCQIGGSTCLAGKSVYMWGAQLEVGPVATSFYPSGTRPLGYIDSWQSYAYDSGNVLACPAPAINLRGFPASQAASAYAFGGGATARHWMPASVNAYGLAVEINDNYNLQGYIEAAFLVAGPYWEAATNFDYGASAQLVDTSKSDRSDAGDLITDAGTVSKKLSIPFSKLSASDRAALWGILRSGGTRYPLFVSMFPGDTDLARERDHQVYGKLVQLPAMALPYYNLASATLEVESV